MALGIPRPKKRDRPSQRRRRETKRKDRAFQDAGSGNCQVCGQWAEQLTRHHKIRRKHIPTRWLKSNSLAVCLVCHTAIHTLGERRVAEKYGVPLQRLLPEEAPPVE